MPIDIEGLAPLIAVFDMPKAVAFYRDILGFEIVAQSGSGDDFDWGLLRCGAAEIMLSIAYDRGERPAVPDDRRIAAHEDAALFFSCRDLDGLYTHLSEKGVALEPPRVTPYGMRQLRLKDPDGYLICFQTRAE